MTSITGTISTIKDDVGGQFVIVLITQIVNGNKTIEQFQLVDKLRNNPEIRSNIYRHARDKLSMTAHLNDAHPTRLSSSIEFHFGE